MAKRNLWVKDWTIRDLIREDEDNPGSGQAREQDYVRAMLRQCSKGHARTMLRQC